MPRYLGQHFLKNKAKLKKIIDALELKDGDIVVEVGPGHGELTQEIQKSKIPETEQVRYGSGKNQSANWRTKIKIIAIEKDINLVKFLKEKFSKDKNIEIIEGDALKEIKNQISKIKITNQNSKIIKNLKIVGNIPYYITGYLLRILGELENKPSLIVLTIQKEVAQRVCAKPRTRRRQGYGGQGMNLLAASVQFWAEPKIIGSVSKKDFWPIPKVDSAIIKLTPLTLLVRSSIQCNKGDYYKFIKILFKQPRKTILNNLLSGIGGKNTAILSDSALSDRIAGGKVNKKKNKEEIIEKLKKVGVDPQTRPQNLSVEQILKLFNFFMN